MRRTWAQGGGGVTIRCSRCNRPLRNPVYIGWRPFGSVCAAAITGAKRKRVRVAGRSDARQVELFAEAAA